MKIPVVYRRSSRWQLRSVQLGGGLYFAVLLPAVLFSLDSFRLVYLPSFQWSVATSALAVIAGEALLRNLIAFPGIRSSSYVLPSFGSSFAAAMIFLFLLRLDYSRPFLLISATLCVSWFWLVQLMLQRQPDLKIGVVPGGESELLMRIRKVAWVKLTDPAIPTGHLSALVADFRADLPDAWESKLADAALAGSSVYDIKHLRESLTGRVEIAHLSENARGTLLPPPAYLLLKMIVDWIAALALIVALLPVLLGLAAWIAMDSHGPVFFRQVRIGYRGIPFMMWKFRTMRPAGAGGDERSAAMTADADDRITAAGRVLRRTRLDELPQLWNVLRGEMSLIGPRPEARVLSHWYQTEIPFYRYRHIVRPGLTGWAQVNQGHVHALSDVTSKLHYDFFYISNFSLWLDILIVLRTGTTVLSGFGSR